MGSLDIFSAFAAWHAWCENSWLDFCQEISETLGVTVVSQEHAKMTWPPFLSGAMDDTHKSQQKCTCIPQAFWFGKQGAVLKGYEPKEPNYCAVMSRSLSLPSSRDHAAVGTGAGEVNPFYSERLQQEIALQERRLKHLPAEDEVRVPPVQDGRPPTGKGQGGDGTGLFATPQSLERPTVYGPQPTGMQSQGAMPMETPPTVQQTMRAMHGSERYDEVGNEWEKGE